ncbi:mechanosensitive ion channel family protein [Halomonas sp. PAMB 3264]|uniref:mechanosensitive ion channel family protein n=1 Tax=Halomonas sp. PAMB 3264 TaxID=3075222 RepID=UPI00289C3C38|nr:mechanosensitive ion channel family protein [Halomonas sp. PAMB 3264]WNL40986.1 mechanosensitive ion channel family protein [Halomonas sp. PAMB 3264]
MAAYFHPLRTLRVLRFPATILLLGMLLSAFAYASDDATAPVEPSGESPAGQIETTPSPQKDAEIAQRIGGIFSEIDGLSAVDVSVTQGIVTLSGETANERKAQQAVGLANRLTDVVMVDDQIDRTLDVQDNVATAYQGLRAKSQSLLRALPLIVVGFLIFGVVAWFGAWLSNRTHLWQRVTPNPFVAELVGQTIKVVFIVLGLIMALSLVGAETIIGTLLGGAGVIGIAIGFAVKDTIENYIASLMLSIRQPFQARDHVVINDREGIVVRLTSRATILMTLEGNQLRIPNADVFKGIILNYTQNPERRFDFELGVDANDDPLAAIKVGLDALNGLPFVLGEPKAVGVITNVGDSNIVLEFQGWVNQSTTDFGKARSIAIRETKHALEHHGFTLPEPIYRLSFRPELEESLMRIQSGKSNERDSALPAAAAPAFDTAADKEKQQAKARAQQILEGEQTDGVFDARPDEKLMKKVEEEIAQTSSETDLLSKRPAKE